MQSLEQPVIKKQKNAKQAKRGEGKKKKINPKEG